MSKTPERLKTPKTSSAAAGSAAAAMAAAAAAVDRYGFKVYRFKEEGLNVTLIGEVNYDGDCYIELTDASIGITARPSIDAIDTETRSFRENFAKFCEAFVNF